MNLERKIALLDEKIAEANNGYPADFDKWKRTTEVAIRLVMGEESEQLKSFQGVRYSPGFWYSGMDTSGYRPAGVKSVVNILRACQDELRLLEEFQAEGLAAPDGDNANRELGPVFIVHGQDAAAKLESARVLEALTGVVPTILHEQPNGGATILEKFERAAGAAGFALVLLTADDLGRSKTADADRPRARQNVVFELGFFFGSLRRERTAVLYDPGVELPSDIQGLVYIERDPAGAWRTAVAKELHNSGYPVNWQALARF